jgi:protein O-GlcNAc transferase
MGITFQDQYKLDEAMSCFQKALKLKPDLAVTYGSLLYVLQETCKWKNMQDVAIKNDELTKKALAKGITPAELPFLSITRHTDLSRNFAVARSWSWDVAGRMSSLKTYFSFSARRARKRRIAIGYLSTDFHDHATAHLMLSLFELHDRNEFDIFGYSCGKDDGSYYRERIQRDCDKFVDVRNLNHADAAKCIYEDEVDVLVDLKGYTAGNRLGICALRPAPVQVTYLGFPGTTGADFFDYIITDRIVTPEDHASFYSEKFVYLPHCYQVNNHTQLISNKYWGKVDFGLPDGGFVFCSFNLPYKIEPVMFDVWMKILRQVPEGVLWLLRRNETAERNLRREAEARGVNCERLVFSGKLPKDEHLARLRLADLALDTRIVNGHTTTSDALWAGVPAITVEGNHFASRVSASILSAIGLPELITHSLDEYQALAVRLAQDPAELHAIQKKLEKNRLTKPLFDTPRFARNIERAYKEMWKIFLAGEEPRQIEVEERRA